MPNRREPVPFAFIAEADRFRSNVTPPPKQRATRSQLIRRAVTGLTLVAGLVGSLLVGLPSLQAPPEPGHTPQSTASHSSR